MHRIDLFKKSKLAVRSRNYDTAFELLDQLIEANPTSAICLLYKCIAILDKENSEKSASICVKIAKNAIDLDKQCSAAFIIHAKCLKTLKRNDEALNSFQTACQLDPENLALAEEKNIAESLLENKPYASGISMLEIKKRIKKNNLQDIALLKQLPPTGEKHLGEKYLHLLNDERIKSFLNKPELEVTEKEPEESDFTLDNIQIPPSRILPDKLTEAQIEALEIKKKGNHEYKEKNFAEALKFYSEAMELDGTDVTFVANKAAVYLEMGEIDSARNCCHHALKIANKHGCTKSVASKVYSRLGNCDKNQKNVPSAQKFFSISYLIDPTEKVEKDIQWCKRRIKEETRRDYFDMEKFTTEVNLAEFLLADKKYQDAIDSCTEAMLRLPDNHREYSNHKANMHSKRAQCYFNLTEYSKCLSDCEAAIAINKELERPWTLKGFCFEAQKLFDQASSAFTMSVRIDPDKIEPQEGLKRCLKASFAVRNGSSQSQIRVNHHVKDILNDEDVQKQLEKIRNREKAEYMRDAKLAGKIQTLIDVGVIQITSNHTKIYPVKCVS